MCGKNVRARLVPFHLNWPEPLFFLRVRTGKCKETLVILKNRVKSISQGVGKNGVPFYNALLPEYCAFD